MNHKGTTVIETERLILRRFTIEGLDEMYINCFSDPEVLPVIISLHARRKFRQIARLKRHAVQEWQSDPHAALICLKIFLKTSFFFPKM